MPPRPPKILTSFETRANLGDLHRRGIVFELQEREARRRRRQLRDQLDAHGDAADRGREVLHHDGNVDGLGDRQVVPLERRVVGPRQLRRRHHHRLGALLLRAPAVGDAAVRARVRRADANREAIAGGLDHDFRDPLALALGELVGLAEHAEDGHAVHAGPARELGQPAQARLVERAVRFERRRRDVVNAGQVFEHSRPHDLRTSRPYFASGNFSTRLVTGFSVRM